MTRLVTVPSTRFAAAFLLATLCSLDAQAQPAPPEPEADPEAEPLGRPEAQALPPEEQSLKTIAERLQKILGRGGGLTSDQVGRRAAATSFDVKAKLQEVRAAEADVDRAVMAFVPRLTLTGRYTRLSRVDDSSVGPDQGSLVGTTAPPGPLPPGAPLIGIPASAFSFPQVLDQWLLNANLTVPISDYVLSTSKAHTAAKTSRRAAELGVQATRLQAAANAKVAYYDWVRARLAQVVANESASQAKAQLDAVKLSQTAGRASDADVLRAEAGLANARLLETRAKSLVRVSEARIRVAMHDQRTPRFEIGEHVLTLRRGDDERGSVESLVREAIRKRLELRALQQTSVSLEKQSSVVRSTQLPRLEAFGNFNYANPNARVFPQEKKWRSTWDIGVQVIWTPNDLGIAPAQARGIDAQREQVRFQKKSLEDAVRLEVTQARSALTEARASVEATKRGLVAAEASYKARSKLYRFGRATSLEVFDAEVALLRARLSWIDAYVALRVARVQLDHAVGRDVKGR